MKKLLAVILSSAILFSLFIGCAKKDTEPTTQGSQAQTSKKDKKIRTDIILANVSDASSLDPHDQTDVYSAAICDMIYSKLFYFDNKATLLPGLAKEWKNISDTEYELKLEKGVKFSNGDELKASDVKFSIERMVKKPKTAALYDSINSVTVVDDYTIKFTTKTPMAPILLNLAGPQAGIVSEKAVTASEANGGKYGEKPIGSGPMILKGWKVNDSILVVRNDNYYKGTPVATSILTRVIPEPSTRTIALEAGDVDFIGAAPAIDIEKIVANKKLKTVEMVGTSISYMGINTQKPPFDNKLLRQAISHAVNRQNIIDICYEGYAVPVTSVFQVMMPSHDPNLNPYPYDVEKAKALMTKAGYPNGGVKMEIGVSSNTSDRVATVIQSDLALIGVEVDIRMQEFGAFLQYLNGKEHDSFILGWSNCYNPDRTMSLMFHSQSSPASGNRVWYANKEVDALIDKAKAEMDWAKREPMYKELQTMILADAPWVPLLQTTSYYAMNANLMDGVLSELLPFHDFTNSYVVVE